MATTSELGVPEIIATTHEVSICGTVVKRPPSISPSQWLWFWNDANKTEAAVKVREHLRRY